jgi:hypothetical protein
MRRVLIATALILAFVGARQRVSRPPVAPPGPTFNKEVSRILQANCDSCHHPGDIGPFSLMTYRDAFPHAQAIKSMTQTRQMPPWKPSLDCGNIADARVLSNDEIDTLAKWADAGAPEGNAADLPAPLTFEGGWSLGQPDAVLSNSTPYTPPAVGDMYRCFTMPTNLIEDQYVSAIDVRPGDRQTVHHVIAFIDTTGESRALDEADPAPGYQCFGGPGFAITNLDASALGGWAPGYRPVMLPEEVALLLPKASRVVLQVHYHAHGSAPQPDQTQIGIYYAKKKPARLLRVLPLINRTFTLAPNDSNARVTAEFKLPVFPAINAHAWLIAPHMHLLGRKMRVEATSVTGAKQCLINIQDWDFNWQGMYRYKDPVPLAAGTTLALEAFYDNSTMNWRNPNTPPKPVSWGEATTDEMCIAFIGFSIDAENRQKGQMADVSWMPHFPQ